MTPDTINGLFEFCGAYFVWRNVVSLYRDKVVKGIYWPTVAFFAAWGIWNLVYYPILGQYISFVCGIFLCTGNLYWIGLMLYYRRQR